MSHGRPRGDLESFATDSKALHSDSVVMGQIEGTCGEGWRVSILIARPSGQQAIRAGDIDARLFDRHGRRILVLQYPEDVWVEAGGAAGTTASADFLFAPSCDEPKLLEVRSRRSVAKLKITPNGR